MVKLFASAYAERALAAGRTAAIAAAAFALAGAAQASAAVIFSNITGLSSPGGYVVGEYSPGSDYALGSNFTVPAGVSEPLLGGSIGVSFEPGSGANVMDLAIAEDVGGGNPVGAVVASAVIADLPVDLAFINFQMSPNVALTPGASYWLLASMPDLSATAYWWAADVPQGDYPVAVSYNAGDYALGSHVQPLMFSITTAPEPPAWAMITIGFAGLAWIASRRRRANEPLPRTGERSKAAALYRS